MRIVPHQSTNSVDNHTILVIYVGVLDTHEHIPFRQVVNRQVLDLAGNFAVILIKNQCLERIAHPALPWFVTQSPARRSTRRAGLQSVLYGYFSDSMMLT